MLTSEQVAKYLKGKGLRCPYCDSDQIEGASFDVQEGWAYQSMMCMSCGTDWTDSYKLLGVIDDEGQYKTGVSDVWSVDPDYPVANARLTAAEPELLDALKDCVSLFPSRDKMNFRQEATFNKAKAAIARVEGE